MSQASSTATSHCTSAAGERSSRCQSRAVVRAQAIGPTALSPLLVLIICTWSRPDAFARYRAASAAASSSVSSLLDPASSAATPIEAVTWTRSPVGEAIGSRAMCARTRSAMRKASVARVCGSSITNSSPPNRPARS